MSANWIGLSLIRQSVRALLSIVFLSSQLASGQSFSIDQHVIAGGGGSSLGGEFSVVGTIGQGNVGTTMSGGVYSLENGFWAQDEAFNQSPTVTPIQNQVISEDSDPLVLPFTIGDSETPLDDLVIRASSSNPSLFPNENILLEGTSASRTVTIYPVVNGNGEATVSLDVGDGQASVQTIFSVLVKLVNDPPVLGPTLDLILDEDSSKTISLPLVDVDSTFEKLAVTVVSLNEDVLEQNALELIRQGEEWFLTVRPAPNRFGEAEILFAISDGEATVEFQRSVSVLPINDPPTLGALLPLMIEEDAEAVVNFEFGDIDTPLDDLKLSVTSIAGNLFDVAGLLGVGETPSGRLTLLPRENISGEGVLVLRLSDGQSEVEQEIPVVIFPVNDPPTITMADEITLDENGEISVPIQVSDPDSDLANLILGGASLNNGLINAQTMVFSGAGSERSLQIRPQLDQSGEAILIIAVTDGREVTSTRVTVTVESKKEPLPPMPAVMEIQRVDGHIVIRWDTKGILQSAPVVDGLYQDVEGAISPFTLRAPIDVALFFRVIEP
jgi:hypothetical protein